LPEKTLSNSNENRASALIAAEIHIQNILTASQFNKDLFDVTLLSGFALKKLTDCFEAYISGTADIPDKTYQTRIYPESPICLFHKSLHKVLLAEKDIEG
jgi:hypothetical protein